MMYISKDGKEIIVNAGDIFFAGPGYDCKVVGNSPAVLLEFQCKKCGKAPPEEATNLKASSEEPDDIMYLLGW